MKLSQEQLEWIVAEVVRRLRAEPSGITANRATVALDERLVTLSTLQGRIDGARSVRVSKSAVLTPAVLDELKSRGIELVRS